jgi:hypothetical protein
MRISTRARAFKPHNEGMLYSSTALFFREFPEMESFVHGTFDFGIWRLGHLVQMQEDDVFRLIPTTKCQRRIIDRKFEISGLAFGVQLDGWAAPEDLRRDGLRH